MSGRLVPRGSLAALAPTGLALVGALLSAGCDAGAADSGSVYVTSGRTDEVVRLAADDGRVLGRIPLDRRRHESDEPHAVVFAPDGRHWYATVAHGQPSLWKFEANSDRLVGRVDLPSGGAAMIGISPDGAMAFVPNYARVEGGVGRVAAIRLRDLHVTGHEAVCDAPHDAAVHPRGDLVAIACAGSDEVLLLDSALVVRLRIPAPASTGSAADHGGSHVPAGGSRPLAVAWSPDGELLAVALHTAGRVWLVDRAGATRALFEVDAGPAQIAWLDDGRLVTANRMGGSMSIVDVSTSAGQRVAIPIEFPHGVALSDDGRVAFIACEGTLSVEGGVVAVDLETRQVLWQQRAGRYVLGVTYSSD